MTLWILGEFCSDSELLEAFLTSVYQSCSPLPFTSSTAGKESHTAHAADETARRRKKKTAGCVLREAVLFTYSPPGSEGDSVDFLSV